ECRDDGFGIFALRKGIEIEAEQEQESIVRQIEVGTRVSSGDRHLDRRWNLDNGLAGRSPHRPGNEVARDADRVVSRWRIAPGTRKEFELPIPVAHGVSVRR